MTQFWVRRVSDLDADKAKFRMQGIAGTVEANSTGNVDWRFPEERWIHGGSLILQGHAFGDKIDVEIVDIDNVLGYGAGLVLDQFADDFYPHTDCQYQGQLLSTYVALIPAGVYLRIKYTNTNLYTSVSVRFNLFSHIPRS